MKLFFDTEFTGLRQNTTLISIGITSDNNKTFYAEFLDYDKSQVDEWTEKNVISKLLLTDKLNPRTTSSWEETSGDKYKCIGNTPMIRNRLEKWLASFASGEFIEMWSDCLAYDWVLFCNIFGGAMNIPENIFYMPFDLVTHFKCNGINPDINREEFIKDRGVAAFFPKSGYDSLKHNALWDAKVIKKCYEISNTKIK